MIPFLMHRIDLSKLRHLKGYALIYTLVFIVLISSALFFFIEARKLESYSIQSALSKQVALLNIKQIMNNQYAQYSDFGDGLNKQMTINSFQFDLKRKIWGLYPLIVVAAKSNRDTFQVASFAGYKSDSTALNILSERQDNILAGGVNIRGDVSLNSGSLKRGVIDGHYFPASQETNTGEITQIDTAKVNALFRSINGYIDSLTKNIIEIDGCNEKIENSFFENSVGINISDQRYIKDDYIGNIILYSVNPITVMSEAHLENCILIAPSIHIQSNFSGRGQFFARDSISISENVTLKYPSVLSVLSEGDNEINIDFNLEYFGFIYAFSEEGRSEISIRKSKVFGDVFTNGKAAIEGELFGRLLCTKTIVRTPKGIYDNYLREIRIDPLDIRSGMLLRPFPFHSILKLETVCRLN